MSTAVAMAFWFHSLLCLAFVATAGCAMAGWTPISLSDAAPGLDGAAVARNEPVITAVFYLSGGLYLLYAELYLFRLQGL